MVCSYDGYFADIVFMLKSCLFKDMEYGMDGGSDNTCSSWIIHTYVYSWKKI